MNFADIEPGLRLTYRVDDHTRSVESGDTVLMVHGLAESRQRSWRAWVPRLSRHHRLLRRILHGYGAVDRCRRLSMAARPPCPRI